MLLQCVKGSSSFLCPTPMQNSLHATHYIDGIRQLGDKSSLSYKCSTEVNILIPQFRVLWTEMSFTITLNKKPNSSLCNNKAEQMALSERGCLEQALHPVTLNYANTVATYFEVCI